MSTPHRDEIMMEIIHAAGGVKRLAVLIGIRSQAVSQWTKIPVNRVLAVERITGIPRERIRPDIFGAPRTRPRRRAALSVAA